MARSGGGIGRNEDSGCSSARWKSRCRQRANSFRVGAGRGSFSSQSALSSALTFLSDPTVVVVQLLSCVGLFVTPWTVARQASLSITNSWSLLKLMSIESGMPSNLSSSENIMQNAELDEAQAGIKIARRNAQ